jgi:3-keto-L-gulonate-6-phosphate decarboxylase
LDVTRADEAIAIADETIEFVDRLEVGTPLVLSEGAPRAISILRARYPNMPLVADCKIMDRGGQISRACIHAGATGVIVQAVAPYETLQAVYQAASEHGAETLVDGLGVDDADTIAWRIGGLPVDYVIVHRGKDEQAQGGTAPLGMLRAAACSVDMPPLAVAGGIDALTLADCIGEPKVKLVIIGEAIVGSASPRAAAREIWRICSRVRIAA